MDTGSVRLAYVNMAFLGPESLTNAAAGECAAEQDLFWAYHDLLYGNWNAENRGRYDGETLKAFASELELDREAFDECLDSGRGEALVRQDNALAQQVGVNSTPTFALNDQLIQGALSYESFRQAIEDALAATAE